MLVRHLFAAVDDAMWISVGAVFVLCHPVVAGSGFQRDNGIPVSWVANG